MQRGKITLAGRVDAPRPRSTLFRFGCSQRCYYYVTFFSFETGMLVIRKFTRLRFNWFVFSSVTFFTFFYILLLSQIDYSPPEDEALLPHFSIISKASFQPAHTSSSPRSRNIPPDDVIHKATRPWIGDPMCEHFTVKVTILYNFSKFKKINYWSSRISWQIMGQFPNGH